MARFQVPSPSPPSSLGSGRSRASGPPFRVPSASNSPASSEVTSTFPELPPGTILPGTRPPSLPIEEEKELESCLMKDSAKAGVVNLYSPVTLDPSRWQKESDSGMVGARLSDRQRRLLPTGTGRKSNLVMDNSTHRQSSLWLPRFDGGDGFAYSKEPINVPKTALPETNIALASRVEVSNLTIKNIQLLLDHPNILPLLGGASPRSQGLRDKTYCKDSDFGTLLDLISSRQDPGQSPSGITMNPLPESFIWHTMISLLGAAHYLHTGGRSSSLVQPSPGWQPIVHNFINPANVFYTDLADDDSTAIAFFKSCLLGNFSQCVVLPMTIEPKDEDESEQVARAAAFAGKITHQTGYEAPELISNDGKIPGPASDLWSIGAVIVAMMTGRSVWHLILKSDSIEEAGAMLPVPGSLPDSWHEMSVSERLERLKKMDDAKLALALPSRYSIELRILVESVLVFNPLDRGNAVDVLGEAEAAYGDWLSQNQN